MSQVRHKQQNVQHMAGIIPIASLETDFETEIPSVMHPYANQYSFIQKAALECATVGCKTIWIVANDDVAPIIRKNVGDYVFDPVWAFRNLSKFHNQLRREVPIYYVPIHPKDRERRDSNGWAALHGVAMSRWVTSKISKWLVADKYYITFPMSAYDFNALREHRRSIIDKEKNFYLTYNGKSVKDNLPLPFTMFYKDYQKCKVDVNRKTTRTFSNFGTFSEIDKAEKLPLDERWSARKFDFSEVYQEVGDKNAIKVEAEWFYNTSIWDEYCAYLGERGRTMRRPTKFLTRTHKHDKIAYNQSTIEGEE